MKTNEEDSGKGKDREGYIKGTRGEAMYSALNGVGEKWNVIAPVFLASNRALCKHELALIKANQNTVLAPESSKQIDPTFSPTC